MKIVALSGWKGSGKDLVASYLIANHGFKRLSFADALKDMASANYNVPRSHFDDLTFKEKPIFKFPAICSDDFVDETFDLICGHLRDEDGIKATRYFQDSNGALMSNDGTECYQLYHTPRSLAVLEGSTKRVVDANYWVKLALKNAEPNGLYVISDLRFRTELDGLKAAAGSENVTSMRILRFENTDQTDASERDLDHYEFDHFIDNSEARQIPKELVFKQVEKALSDAGIILLPKENK